MDKKRQVKLMVVLADKNENPTIFPASITFMWLTEEGQTLTDNQLHSMIVSHPSVEDYFSKVNETREVVARIMRRRDIFDIHLASPVEGDVKFGGPDPMKFYEDIKEELDRLNSLYLEPA